MDTDSDHEAARPSLKFRSVPLKTLAHDVARRAAIDVGSGSPVKKLGCRNTVDVITTVTRVSVREVRRRLMPGNFTRVRAGVGARLPVLYPAVGASAECSGHV